ncbi:unnamed protein product [marine sediment metagenome]|uniref:Minor capsid protein P8 central region domain-containing protein n=1 Tax=marine sediment metagenome TaxID=412755 RepID=X0SQP8_9ZZZZ
MSSEIGKIITENKLSRLFFSDENKNIIQNAIRYSIYTKTSKIISRQSDRELDIIMRSIYLQYSKNNNFNFRKQVDDLNKLVIDYSVNIIYTNLNQHLKYIKKINKLPLPISHPKNVSNTGSKSLIFNKF